MVSSTPTTERWTRLTRNLVRSVAMTAVAVVTVLANSPAASAHAQLITSNPTDGAVLASSPATLVLEWSEPVKSGSDEIRLVDSAGEFLPAEVVVTSTSSTGRAVITPSKALHGGAWALSWKAVSADGHLVGGAVSFSVGHSHASAVVPVTNRSADGGGISGPLDRAAETGTWMAAILALGALWGGRRRLAVALGSVTALLAVLRFAQFWHDLNHSPIQMGGARATLAVGVTGALVALAAYATDRISRVLSVAAVCSFAAQMVFSGHQLDLQGSARVIAVFSGVAHLVGAMCWIAAVFALFLKPDATQAARTRRIATVSIGVLLVGAGVLTVSLALPLSNSNGLRWLVLLGVKIGFVLVALALGALNHRRLAPARVAEMDGGKLRRVLVAELGVMMAIMATTGVLVQSLPPTIAERADHRSITAQSSDTNGTTTVLSFDDGSTGRFEAAPTRAGQPSMWMLTITAADGSPVAAREVRIIASNTALGIEGVDVSLAGGNGHFMGEGKVPVAGTWRLHIEALLDEFTMIQGETTMEVSA